MTNHVDFAMNYWEAGLPLRTGFDDSAESDQSYSLAWETVLEEEIIEFSKTLNCFDGFSFIDRYHDTIQFASFLRSSPVKHPGQFYQKNQNAMRLWLREFERKHRGLIRHAEDNPMQLPEEYLAPQQKTFYPKRTVKLCYRHIQSRVSFRELDCLHLYSRGFTIQKIAAMLELSPRTVETHLLSVKNQFGLFTRDDLATLAYANPMIQGYSPRF